MRLSVCQVQRIVSDYESSVAAVAAVYDSEESEDSDQETPDTIVEAEEEHFDIAWDLYGDYAYAVSNALIDAPVLFNLKCKGFEQCEHVLIAPTHAVPHPDDLMPWSERDRFFISGLDDLVIPALSEALATM